ncbi:phosphoribosyltransferase [Comamonas sp. lk]|uniref:phosphoribosyltransferase n=1 Tax=Comamonas sp. lk TaxID=2201272 RepID=UPI000EB5D680|nr:phosphoribosyltransferase [Comamonas sp. lk]
MSKNPFDDPNFGAPTALASATSGAKAAAKTPANPFDDPEFGKEAPSPGLLRSAGDSAIALGSGITQGVKMLTDVAGADNSASRVLGKATDALTDLASPYTKAKKQERAAKIKAAEDSGSTWEEVKAYAGSFADAPLDTTLNALGTSAPALAAGLLSGGAAVPAIAVRAAQVGLGAAQGLGGIKGQIHESVKQKHLEAGASEADASQRADAAQAYTGPNAGSIALGGVLGAAAGGTGAESAVRRLAGQRVAAEAAAKAAPGVLRSTAMGAAKEAPMEMLQGGQERHASNTALQGEGFDVPTWQGVAGQAALEGLASAPMGGGFGAMEGMAHKGAAQRQSEGAAAFASGEPRTPPESIKSVVAKAQWVRGWNVAQAQAQEAAAGSNPMAEPSGVSAEQPGATNDMGQEATLYADGKGNVGATPEDVTQATEPVATPAPVGDSTTNPDAAPGTADLGSVTPEVPVPELTPSQAMGLDPNVGALSKAAAMAVDSGASQVLQTPTVAVEPAPVLEQAAAQVPAGVDPETGEVSLQTQMDELKDRIAFMQQQGAAQGWSKDMVAQRNALQSQLTRMEVQSAAGQAQGASTTGAPAPAQLSGITQILAKQVPAMSEDELQQAIAYYGPNHKRTKKLEKALQALAQKTLTAIETGAISNVSQADQAQQGSPQPAQAGAAQAGQAAAQGVADGGATTVNPGAQSQGTRDAKAQAQVSEAAGAAVAKAAQIARDGNAEREQERQRQLDASERWTRMTTVERQALAKVAPGLNAIAKANVHGRAWGDLSEKVRGKLADAMGNQTAVAGKGAGNQLAPLVNSAPQAIETVANSPAAQTPVKQGAQPVGDEKLFAAESGTLGIPRADMPQVPAANHGGMVKHLNAQGIAHETKTVDAAALKPTQAEYSPSKVEAAKSAAGDRSVIVSSDGHIIDGHHQAVAAAEEGKQVKAIVLDAPVEQALAAVKASPSANVAPANEPTPAPKSVPQRMKEAKAAKDEAAASKRAEKPKSVPAKMREAMAARATERVAGGEEAPSFRRQESEQLAGADFDVDSFLKTMNEGQPALQARGEAGARVKPAGYSPAARAQAVRAVQGTADAVRKAWANGPEVIVAFDMQDTVVPESARRADLKQRSGGAQGTPEGFYYQGKVYLMASKLKKPNDAARVLFHEALGHHGLRGLFGKDLGLILNQVAAMRKAEVDAKIEEYGLRRVNRLDRRTAAEEVLAEMAQSTPQIGFVRRAVAAVRTWLRTHVPGFKSLALTDAELIRNYILPARAWVERGAGAGSDQDIAFSRSGATSMPDAIIGSVLGAASSHPDYAAAKSGDIEAAFRLAQDIVTPDLVAKVRAVIGDSKPLVVPVAAEEATGRNRIPVAAAGVLAQRLGLSTTGAIVQANRAHRTGMDGLDRIFAPVDFAGAVEAKPYLLVDDTLTQGGTFTALASHIREGGGTVAGVIALTGKQYSAKIQPSAATLASLRQKHGDLENEFRAATGYGFDALTESEARYLARYEPADRLRDRISAEGHRSRAGENTGNAGSGSLEDGPVFSRTRLADLKTSALDQLSQTFAHEGKVSLWDKSVGTMRHLGERAPAFKPVYESAQQNIDDVSMLANDAADMAPRILPRVESLGDLKKKPVSAEDNKAVAKPLFEGTLIWARDENGKPTLVDDLQKRHANLSVHNKAAMLLKHGKIDAGLLAMWQGLPMAQFEKLIDSRFESKFLKAGIVWSDAELQSMFGANANQISLYREARAAIDRSIDMTARTDMLRVVGEKYEPMREAVLAQPSVEAAAQLLLDTLEQDAKADPDARDRLAGYMQLINRRLETAVDLQKGGYAPLSRFGRYTVDVVDAAGERQYFGMYETARESNLAKMQLAQEFKGATITTGTMSAEAYKLFAGVTPETLEQFGEMLGLKSEGNEAQDKAFQEFLKLTKNNHSAMKRLIHRKGVAGFSQDVGRVVANFVYSNARAGAMGLNAGKMETAIGAIPKDQGELKDLAMGLRDYIRDPQEEGQAVRGMLFAQYLGGSLASAFVNMTQPFQITMPWLSQYGGMRKAAGQMARALKDMGRSVADKSFQYEPDLAKALKAAEDDGTVSPQEIHALMAQARGNGMLRSGDGTKAGNLRANAANKWEQGKVLWGQPFALAEQFNRRSTFIASYRIAKEQGMADPAGFARKAVLETQFVYSKANKPKWARGAVGGTLFTFKTYSVSYLELMQRMWNQGPAGSPERAAGRRAVGWALAMLVLMSGAGGVPFMEDAEDLIDGMGQLAGYNISSKQWRKEFLAGAVGKELADFMEQGISGLPGAPVDVSGRLGMGNLIPGTGLFLEKPNRERDLTEIVGPAGDLVSRGFGGARDVIKGMLNGDVATAGKGVLEWTPTAVRNAFKGGDMAASGMYKDSKGYKVIDATLAEAAAKFIGFQPKSVAEDSEATGYRKRSESFYKLNSAEIKAQWADALFRKDEAALQRVRERLAKWNRDNPDQPMVVRQPDVWEKVREMGKDRAQRIADMAPKALREQMREQARSLS